MIWKNRWRFLSSSQLWTLITIIRQAWWTKLTQSSSKSSIRLSTVSQSVLSAQLSSSDVGKKSMFTLNGHLATCGSVVNLSLLNGRFSNSNMSFLKTCSSSIGKEVSIESLTSRFFLIPTIQDLMDTRATRHCNQLEMKVRAKLSTRVWTDWIRWTIKLNILSLKTFGSNLP